MMIIMITILIIIVIYISIHTLVLKIILTVTISLTIIIMTLVKLVIVIEILRVGPRRFSTGFGSLHRVCVGFRCSLRYGVLLGRPFGSHRWNRNPRPRLQKCSKLVFQKKSANITLLLSGYLGFYSARGFRFYLGSLVGASSLAKCRAAQAAPAGDIHTIHIYIYYTYYIYIYIYIHI